MKKRILVLAVMVICIAIAVSGSIAYFTAEDTARNVITTGEIGIKLIEKMKTDKGTLVDFPEGGISGIMPGSVVSKIVRVQNTGTSEAWIRVSVEAAITAADGSALEATVGAENRPVMNYSVQDGWTGGNDGYYYYEKPVAAGDSTGILFDEVIFDSGMDNRYQNCTADIDILAQAVQVANNGDSVTEAQGWPEK